MHLIEPRPDLEARVYASAEALLRERRIRIARLKEPLRQNSFILNDSPVPAALLILASFAFLFRQRSHDQMKTVQDLPEFSNHVPELYESEWHAQRQAEDKEIKDAHDEASGGV